jgi:hypothetical protein
VNNSGNTGDTLCVTASITSGTLTVNTSFASQVRIIAQPADQTIDMTDVSIGSSTDNVTIESFEFTNEHGVSLSEGMNTVKFVKNRFHDQKQDPVEALGCTGTRDNFYFIGNVIDTIEYDGVTFPAGYGIAGECFNGLYLWYNECNGESSTNNMADCWEIGDTENFQMIGNYIHDNACGPGGCDISHADGWQFWDDSNHGIIRDNVVITFAQTTPSPDGDDYVIDNNLFVNAIGNCVDAHQNGTSGDVQPFQFVVTNNTVWDCGSSFGAWVQSSSLAGRGSNVWEDNIFEDASCVSGTFATAPTGNVINGGTPCGISSVTNYTAGWTPNWNGTDFGSAGQNATYQATNLPGGYENAGYQPAPFGPAHCGLVHSGC